MSGDDGTHVLVFPYPAQGHMLSLLDFTHQLAIRGLTITILVTPKNLPILNPLLSKHPSIQTLVLPFPSHPSIPAGVENTKDVPSNSFRVMIHTLGGLYDPLLRWFRTHPSPPVAIFSDNFLGWTHHLACELGIRRFVFSPSGVMAMSVVYALWRNQPRRNDPSDRDEMVSFTEIPNSPVYPWWQLSPVYRSYAENEGEAASEFIKEGYLGNMESWGLVFNSFTELERVYVEHLVKEFGHDRVWTVGPLLPPEDDQTGPNERGGSSSVSVTKIVSWLDTCDDRTVVYVCFGSQAVLTNRQMEELTLGLEKSGVRFILSVKDATVGHLEGEYGKIPEGFEDRVDGRALVIREWAPQVTILRHRAVAAFLTHCGWNSVLEGLMAGVPMLAWPMGADQFVNATLLVEELKVAIRVCEGAATVPNSGELARWVAEAASGFVSERERAAELRKAALDAIKEGGTSFNNLDGLVSHLSGSM